LQQTSRHFFDLWSAIEEIAGGWDGDEDEIAKLKKLLAYAKRQK
jgi:hypothetical protein